MTKVLIPLLAFTASFLHAQDLTIRHDLEFGGGVLAPVGGYKAGEYSTGPELRVGYQGLVKRHFALEVGWTGAWDPGNSCSRFGCSHPTVSLKLLDYGFAGVLPLAAGRVELEGGIGGGYIWYSSDSGDSFYDGALLQYFGKASVAMDRGKRFRVAITVRTWRDLGRPIQQWLSPAASVTYSFGSR